MSFIASIKLMLNILFTTYYIIICMMPTYLPENTNSKIAAMSRL